MATKNLIAHAAHNRVYRAIRRGDLPHPYYLECSKCGWAPSEYHHPDYRKPLKVVRLCRWCHKKEHKRIRAKALSLKKVTTTAKRRSNRK